MLNPLLLGIAAITSPAAPVQAPTKIGIFDLQEIRSTALDAQVVKKTEANGVITEEIRFTSAPGIRAFAYLCYPKGGKKLPTNVTIRNYGAEARQDEAATGFATWSVCAPEGNTDPTKKLTTGGPKNNEQEQFTDDYRKSWVYHHVVAQLRGMDYLATRPEIDIKRVVVTGFSWSGYVGALMHALDNRPVCYVTWNSTGYFADPAGISGDRKSRISRKMYEMYAPSYYAQYGTQPLFVGNALTDYFATLDGAIEMYKKLKSPKRFVFAPNRYHADTERKEYSSSGAYMWTYQGNGPKTASVSEGTVDGSKGKLVYSFDIESSEKPERAEILYSVGAPGNWTGRTWHRKTAVLSGGNYVAELPVYDPDVPLYAVAQIETKSFRASANCPQLIEPRRLGISAPTASYPNMLLDFEDKSDLYVSIGTPKFVADPTAPSGKVVAQITPFTDGTLHLANIEPFLWKNGKTLSFWLKGDGKPGPVSLYLTRSTNYYLDKDNNNFVKLPIVPAGQTFKAGWQEFQIPLDKIPQMNKVDALYFELPTGRTLTIDAVRWQ
jgi:dienelactone hydrolase